MKRFFHAAFLTIATVLFCASSCGGDGPVEPVSNPFLSATPTSLDFPEDGGTKTVNVSSSISPNINCQQSWIKVNKGTYSDTQMQLTVVVDANTTTSERTGMISVNGDKTTVNISVKQAVKEIPFTVDKSSVSSKYCGEEIVLAVTSTAQPSVSGGTDWCKASCGTIDGDHKTEITILIGPNRGASARSAEIKVTAGSQSKTVSISQPAMISIPAAFTTALTPEKAFDAMRMGWGLGNQMDAFSNDVASETVWGNEKCTQATMTAIKAAGFKTVRIPVTWLGKFGPAPYYKIDDKWLDRVAEIVGYAEKAGLVAIINMHHDENNNDSHWQDVLTASKNNSKNEEIKNQIFSMWTQIANKFKDKGEFLVFEPFNEIQDGGWGWSDAFKNDPAPQYRVLNEWNQTFVDAVRATGGNNATRWLAAVGYCQSPTFTIKGLELPKDYTSANRLIVAVHDYDPYDYTINSDTFSKCSEWGHTAAKEKTCSSAEKDLVYTFDEIVSAYIAKGIPVYIGEMGCSCRSEARAFLFQKYYMEYFCKAAADRLLPCILWDNGVEGYGNDHMGYLKHSNGAYVSDNAKQLVQVMVKAQTEKSASYTLESVYNSAPK